MARLDTQMLTQLQELLGARFPELVQRFEDDGARRLALLHVAVDDLDFEAIHAEAHGLKGSSRNMGANTLGDLCAEIEERGRTQDPLDLTVLRKGCEQEFKAVCQLLRQHLVAFT